MHAQLLATSGKFLCIAKISSQIPKSLDMAQIMDNPGWLASMRWPFLGLGLPGRSDIGVARGRDSSMVGVLDEGEIRLGSGMRPV